jgi:hypothetical protein
MTGIASTLWPCIRAGDEDATVEGPRVLRAVCTARLGVRVRGWDRAERPQEPFVAVVLLLVAALRPCERVSVIVLLRAEVPRSLNSGPVTATHSPGHVMLPAVP